MPKGQVGRMEYFVQQLINGITLGSIYGLIAIGYTMVYGIIGMINFAHGEVFMIGAFISLIGFMICGLLGIGSAPVAIVLVLLIAMALLTSALTRSWGFARPSESSTSRKPCEMGTAPFS